MPWLNLIVVFGVIGIAVIWGVRGTGRGAFSSFLAMICTVASGGVAFGLWEVVTGLMPEGLGALAPALGLILPFALSMVVFRALIDFVFVRSNIMVGEIVDFVGGALFGVVMGVLTMGVFVVAVSHLPLGPTILGFEAVDEDAPMPVADGRLWVPADDLTLAFYEHLSETGFASGTPLAVYRPDAAEGAHLSRMTASRLVDNSMQRAKSRMSPDDVEVSAWYRIDAGDVRELLIDRLQDDLVQQVVYPWSRDGDAAAPSNGDALYGVVMTFESGAVETSGQFVIGTGQVRLVVQDGTGDARGVHPMAIIAPADTEASSLTRFAVRPRDFIGSQGATSQNRWGFEFMVPAGYEPVSLFVKQARVELPEGDAVVVESTEVRDDALADNEFFSGVLGVRELGVIAGDGRGNASGGGEEVTEGISATERIPTAYRLLTQNVGRGAWTSEGSNNVVISLNQQFNTEQLQTRGRDRSQVIDRYQTTRTTGIVQVTLATQGAESLFGRSVRTAQAVVPVLLRDTAGRLYEPVGFIYDDASGLVQWRYTPDEPIRALSQIPQLSLTQRGHTLILVYRVTKGAEISDFMLGNEPTLTLDTPVTVN